MRFRLILMAGFASVVLGGGGMEEPKYRGEEMLRPEGYREWMFISASYGLGYSDPAPGEKPAKPGTFHNMYMQREAYKHYVKTGKFPDKTMIVMEVAQPGTKVSINKTGAFEEKYLGVEVAVKDEKRFADKWAYFNFMGNGGKSLDAAKAFPKQACWDCHNKNGAVDNVFVQFYPVLRAARAN
jgi:hypothetical protein